MKKEEICECQHEKDMHIWFDNKSKKRDWKMGHCSLCEDYGKSCLKHKKNKSPSGND